MNVLHALYMINFLGDICMLFPQYMYFTIQYNCLSLLCPSKHFLIDTPMLMQCTYRWADQFSSVVHKNAHYGNRNLAYACSEISGIL